MKTLILYRSKTGLTKRYAEWLRDALNADMAEWKEVKHLSLADYDRLIYGAGFYAGTVAGVKAFLQKAIPFNKQLIVFATGASPVETEETLQSLRRNFTDDQWKRVHAFYLPGGMCYEKMNLLSRAMMAVFRAMMKKQQGADSPVYRQLQKSYDVTDPKHLEPILSLCREA